MSEIADREEALIRLAELVDDIEFAMFTTVNEEGELRSRPMASQKLDQKGGVLWFFTRDVSAKSDDANQEIQVNVAFADLHRGRYVSISGEASIVYDQAKIDERWAPTFEPWFPDGPGDPHLCLIRVDIERAEYWDNSTNRMVYLEGFVKSAANAKPLKNPSDHKKLNLH